MRRLSIGGSQAATDGPTAEGGGGAGHDADDFALDTRAPRCPLNRRSLPPPLRTASSASAAIKLAGPASVWLELDASEIAQHLTCVDESLYHRVPTAALLSYAWPRGATLGSRLPLLKFSQAFNTTASAVASAVVTTHSMPERAMLIAHFVAVAAELRRLANFNGLTAVLAGLGHSAVHRLRGAKSLLPADTCAAWSALESTMSPTGSYAEYRAALKQQLRSPPFIPYAGVHFTDLTFIGEGNGDHVGGGINFDKRQKVHGVLMTCLAGRTERYTLCPSQSVASVLDASPRLPDDELFQNSLQLEPRGVY